MEIAGTERPVNAKVENVMRVLSDKKKALTKARSAHKDAEARVLDLMREEKLEEYTSEDLGLTLTVDDVEHAKLAAYHPQEEKRAKATAEA